ncbi:MAG: ABC transporter ATP-binding protein [Treponema sp.]|nr:ABC transporter ATP-binding protein [Treponema sp.]
MALLTVSNLKKRFNLEAGFFARVGGPYGKYIQAVNGLDFYIDRNESYGLVGESGCGKTTTARLLVRMYSADEGEILFNEADNGTSQLASQIAPQIAAQNVGALNKKELKNYREKVKYIFQDPARSLNPRMTVYEVLTSGRRWSDKKVSEKQNREDAAAILEETGLSAADLERRPSEFSGGQRQRISIARALLMKPELLICDEVVSALDVSIQGQILNLLLDIRSSRGLSFLFIAHDLRVACYFCDRIGVMYRGEMMEEADAKTLWKSGLHPYTGLLFSSAGKSATIISIKPDEKNSRTAADIAGCVYADRCPYAQERCFLEKPLLRSTEPGHRVRCFRAGSINVY